MSNKVALAKYSILSKIKYLPEDDLKAFEKWISSKSYKDDLQKQREINKSEIILDDIATSIKSLYPEETKIGKLPFYKNPQILDQCLYDHTLAVDDFLYSDKEIEKSIENKTIKEHYCLNCKSRNIDEYIFISHSMSRQTLLYLFKVLLPIDLKNKQIMDVGSRLGAVIFTAYLTTNLKQIVGIEINEELCEIQEQVIKKFSFDPQKIKVVCDDVLNQAELVSNTDVIIINVLDFFVDVEKHRQMWYFFKNNIKKGAFLITNRNMVDTLTALDIYKDFSGWITVCEAFQKENYFLFCNDNDNVNDLHLYKVNIN